MCISHTDVIAALGVNGGDQNMGEKILSIIPINKKNQIIR